MKPDLLSIGPFTVHGYGLMIAIGVLAAYIVAEQRAKRKGMDESLVFSLFMWCLLGGIIGAKLLYWITELKSIIADPKMLLDFANGFVIYGAVLGGIAAALIYCKKKNIKFLEYFDLCMPSVALAQGFGRLGCFMAGCCYGVQTNSWFGIVFSESKIAPNGVRLFPTELISSAYDFLMFFVLISVAKKKRKDGMIGCLYLLIYSIGRFIIEFFRGDLERGSVGVLSTSQFIAIIVVVLTAALIFIINRRSKRLDG